MASINAMRKERDLGMKTKITKLLKRIKYQEIKNGWAAHLFNDFWGYGDTEADALADLFSALGVELTDLAEGRHIDLELSGCGPKYKGG